MSKLLLLGDGLEDIGPVREIASAGPSQSAVHRFSFEAAAHVMGREPAFMRKRVHGQAS